MLIKRLCFFVIINFFHLAAYAGDISSRHKSSGRRIVVSGKSDGGIGNIADNLFGFGQSLSQLFKTTAIMTGIAIILFGIIQYGKYRKNPVEMPFSKVIMTIVVGLCLIALSFIPMRVGVRS